MPDPIDDYLVALPEDRRAALAAVRQTILANLPEGYEEAFDGRYLLYQLPLDRYPDTYNKQPLQYVALASQKRHMALYLQGVYASPALLERFLAAYRATGKRLDMGKSCVRFRTLDDLPLDVIGKSVAAMPLEKFVAFTKAAHAQRPLRPRSTT